MTHSPKFICAGPCQEVKRGYEATLVEKVGPVCRGCLPGVLAPKPKTINIGLIGKTSKSNKTGIRESSK